MLVQRFRSGFWPTFFVVSVEEKEGLFRYLFSMCVHVGGAGIGVLLSCPVAFSFHHVLSTLILAASRVTDDGDVHPNVVGQWDFLTLGSRALCEKTKSYFLVALVRPKASSGNEQHFLSTLLVATTEIPCLNGQHVREICWFWDGRCRAIGCGAGMWVDAVTQTLGWHTVNKNM